MNINSENPHSIYICGLRISFHTVENGVSVACGKNDKWKFANIYNSCYRIWTCYSPYDLDVLIKMMNVAFENGKIERSKEIKKLIWLTL